MGFQYYMPTQVFYGSLDSYAAAFTGFGKRALIVTGRSSASNGALENVYAILRAQAIEAVLFDRVEENPSVENVTEAARVGLAAGADFIIGIGGGSPLDAAKAAALLLNHPACLDTAGESLYDIFAFPNGAAPVLAVPTTAGTGSEVTPFAIITRHSHQTKASLPHLVFPRRAFLNPAYTAFMSERLTLHTAVDALAHIAEGYLSSRATPVTDAMSEGGLAVFGSLREALTERRFDAAVRETLLSVSALAGIIISQAKTTLPHQLGYALTYYQHIPHGAACGLLLPGYIRFHQDKKKTGRILALLGLSDVDSFKNWLYDLIAVPVTLTEREITAYVDSLWVNPERLKAHPGTVTREDLTALYNATMTPPKLA